MRIITGITQIGKYTLPFEAIVPEVADVRKALPKHAAELAIQTMTVEESFIAYHLSIGSTPPTRLPVWKVPWRLRIIQSVIWKLWNSSRGCICI